MSLTKKSLTIAGHATSIALEPEFWRELETAAREQGKSLPALVAEVDAGRAGALSSTLRLYALQHARSSLSGG
jgi:predicted DNA-binding ribbon-helix-helix protein